uniref:Squamosa promoter binding protein n=1 Tax=Sesuvium portulacastrum TaxID=221166 RepID=A0A2I7ZAU9_SESPO|nr:squamosa promoter binding protein [Sesuvium portulacastrum]
MGYNLKTNYCDFAELERGGIATIFGSNSQSTEGESIVDLKLGSLGDFGEGLTNRFKDPGGSLMETFSSSRAGSSKRSRTPSSGGQVVSCLVDGCKSDLSKCRDYHRRHKVCEMHSKTPRVTIGGHEQRFCQQCSRFHALGEFDEGKRSCRKRLEGHNRRRRKPQPEPLPVNQGNFLSASQGSRFLPFSNQPIIPASSVVSTTTWSGAVKTESNPALYSSSVSGPYSQPYRGRQFPFLQRPDSPLTGGASSAGQMVHHDPNSVSGNGGSSSSNTSNNNNNDNQKMFCNGLNQVINPDRALSLLSSSPAETPEMGLGRVIHSSPINPARPIITSLQYNSIGPFHPGSQAQAHDNSALISNMRNNNSICQDVFQGGSDGSSGSGGHQTLSFSWE